MQKTVNMSFEGKDFSNIYDSEKMTPGVHVPQSWGYIHVYDHNS